MHLPYDAVLFDLDGTLTMSHPGIVACADYALRHLGMDPEGIDLTSFIGPPLYESFRAMGIEDQTARAGIAIFREKYAVDGWSNADVFCGIPSLLRSLKKRGAYLAVATAKPEEQALRVLEYFGLTPYFDKIATADNRDEHCDKARLIQSVLPKTYHRACMVGDRRFDMDGAARAGVGGIGILYGYGTREELEASGATTICETTQALEAMLLGGEAPARGAFITLEGPDGGGKTTQAKLLAGWLRKCGHRVVETREPGGCPVAERIRSLVLDVRESGMRDLTEAYLFAAARAQHVEEVVLPALMRGDTVVCDRFVDSSIAYQGYGRGLGIERVWAINREAVSGLMPDLTFLLMLDPETGRRRVLNKGAFDRLEKDADLAARVAEYFGRLARQEPQRVRTVDASAPVEQIHETIRQTVSKTAL